MPHRLCGCFLFASYGDNVIDENKVMSLFTRMHADFPCLASSTMDVFCRSLEESGFAMSWKGTSFQVGSVCNSLMKSGFACPQREPMTEALDCHLFGLQHHTYSMFIHYVPYLLRLSVHYTGSTCISIKAPRQVAFTRTICY